MQFTGEESSQELLGYLKDEDSSFETKCDAVLMLEIAEFPKDDLLKMPFQYELRKFINEKCESDNNRTIIVCGSAIRKFIMNGNEQDISELATVFLRKENLHKDLKLEMSKSLTHRFQLPFDISKIQQCVENFLVKTIKDHPVEKIYESNFASILKCSIMALNLFDPSSMPDLKDPPEWFKQLLNRKIGRIVVD